MKKIKNDTHAPQSPPKTVRALSKKLARMAMSNLEDPAVERRASALLVTVRNLGFQFQDPHLECGECLSCLHFSLMEASEVLSQAEMAENRIGHLFS
jgi:hypothetical protein